jgi:DNA recombination protein RmuC
METYILIAVALIACISVHFATKSYLIKVHQKELLDKAGQVAALEQQLAEMKIREESSRKSIEEVKAAMLDSFKSAAADALGQNNKQFLTLAQTQFTAHKSEAATDLETRKKAIEDLLKPVKEAIDTYKTKVEELGNTSNMTFGRVAEMMEKIQATHSSLQRETGALVNALRNPRVRGRWGEIGLKRLVEFSGMSAHCDFVEQVCTEGDDESMLKPDMIIKLPGNAHVVVDSKLPLDAYLEALETDDETARNLLIAKHAKALRDRITKLSKKQYWSQFENTPDFVVLYMEIESAFNAALMADKSLLQDAIGNKIILATPTTLIVILKSVAMSWQQHNITKNALEIQSAAIELHSRMTVFSGYLTKLGKGLKSALDNYNEVIGSYTARLLPQGRKLEELGATSNKQKVPQVKMIENTVRELNE